MKKLLLYFNTLAYLKPIQFRCRLYYLLRNKWRRLTRFHYRIYPAPPVAKLKLLPSIPTRISYNEPGKFDFLNIERDFGESIDWNFDSYGKLWTYNLNYFEYLEQPGLTKQEGLTLIKDQISKWTKLKDGLDAFPLSLSIIFWIKFLVKHGVEDPEINRFLYAKVCILSDKIEYHLLGNHLLENGFALFFGGVYFNNQKFLTPAVRILKEELQEQVLGDGGHFERSPMYHSLILYRLLDCINLISNNPHIPDQTLFHLLRDKAGKMLGWLKAMAYKDNCIEPKNDSTKEIAPSLDALLEYAKTIGVKSKSVQLGESGYRKMVFESYEVLLDAGNIGPDYQPGHAHSDTLSFEMRVGLKPFLVDPGISTYEKNDRRQWERSTEAHNTVQIGGIEQTQVWGGFRVAKRAKAFIIKETETHIEATHNGYKGLGIAHHRSWTFFPRSVKIYDQIRGFNKYISKAFFHFHPSVSIQVHDSGLNSNMWKISFQGADQIVKSDYQFAAGYNRLQPAQKITVYFKDSLITHISE